jgi:hypothetical protein
MRGIRTYLVDKSSASQRDRSRSRGAAATQPLSWCLAALGTYTFVCCRSYEKRRCWPFASLKSRSAAVAMRTVRIFALTCSDQDPCYHSLADQRIVTETRMHRSRQSEKQCGARCYRLSMPYPNLKTLFERRRRTALAC